MNNNDSNHSRMRLRVLVADDSAAIRDSLSSLISRLPDVEIVGMARSGLEAYELIRNLKPDVVTLDIRMPEMSGINVLEAIKKQQLETTVIVLTGLAEMEYRVKCTELGAKFFFHKSTEFEKVIEVLSDYRDRLNLQQAQLRDNTLTA
jgi:YesN/AraC family two-component response regulator